MSVRRSMIESLPGRSLTSGWWPSSGTTDDTEFHGMSARDEASFHCGGLNSRPGGLNGHPVRPHRSMN